MRSAVTGGGTNTEIRVSEESKSGEDNSPAVPAGDGTCGLPITSLELNYQTSA